MRSLLFPAAEVNLYVEPLYPILKVGYMLSAIKQLQTQSSNRGEERPQVAKTFLVHADPWKSSGWNCIEWVMVVEPGP
jgi:hypothetical protein